MIKLKQLMGLKKNEGKITAFSIGYASLIGLVQSYLKTIPMVLFLTHYHSATLPYIYITSSVVLVILGILYSLIERKIDINRLAFGLIIILISSFLFFWSLEIGLDTKWIYLALLIWAQASFDIFDLQLWAVLNRLFNLDQSKRLFGTIGMYQSLAGIIGGLTTPLLILTLGAENGVFIVAIIAICCAILLRTIVRTYPDRFEIKNPSQIFKVKEKLLSQKKFNWHDSYLINNMLFASASLFIYTIVDYLFYTEGKSIFPNQIEFGTFLGIFFAVLNSFDLINRGLVARILLQKFGVKIGLLIRTVCVGSLTIVLLSVLPFNSDVYAVFLLCSLIKIFDEGLSNSILRQSVLILYQPLPPSIRTSLQSKIELLIIPFSTILASLAIIAMQHLFNFHILYLALLIMVIIGITFVVGTYLQKGYVDKLKCTLVKRGVPTSIQNLVDKNYFDLLINRIQHGTPNEIIYCLNLTKKINHNLFVTALGIALSSNVSLIKSISLNYLSHTKAHKLIAKIKNIIINDPDQKIRSAALKALLFQDKKNQNDLIKDFLNNKNILILKEAIIAVINNEELDFQRDAQQKLLKLAGSEDENERVCAANIIEEIDVKDKYSLILITLLHDKNKTVVKSAILAASKFQDEEILRIVLNFMENSSLRKVCSYALIKSGDKALNVLIVDLEYSLKVQNLTKVQLILKMLGFIKQALAIKKLLQLLKETASRTLRNSIVEALDAGRFKATTHSERNEINKLIDLEIIHLKYILSFQRRLSVSKEAEELSITFEKHIKNCKKNIFRLLGFTYSRNIINKISFYLDSKNLDKASYAKELLEHILLAQHKKFIGLINQSHLEDDSAPKNSRSELVLVFREILLSPTCDLTNLIKAVTIYLVANLKLKELVDELGQAVRDEDPLVNETANWAIARLKV